jgi:hypothetical protein
VAAAQQPASLAAAAGGGFDSASSSSGAYGSPQSSSFGDCSSGSSPQGVQLSVGEARATPQQQQAGAALAPARSAADDVAAALTDAEWSLRARRLECLMCRVLWVAESLHLFAGQYTTPRVAAGDAAAGAGSAAAAGVAAPPGTRLARTTPADMLQAGRWVKEQSEELDTAFQASADELSLLRSKVQQLAW